MSCIEARAGDEVVTACNMQLCGIVHTNALPDGVRAYSLPCAAKEGERCVVGEVGGCSPDAVCRSQIPPDGMHDTPGWCVSRENVYQRSKA